MQCAPYIRDVMRLKNIKLAGFKSFVDPTTIPFDKDLVAVVGPNGCGKSNVVDAIRWVMGESSAKNLRGESMADVIFNGSSGRKPVSQASVQLTFDNSDGSIGGEYATYSEIAIKRLASRDGTSNYFLNNVKCRRKDITDVFLGTGLGPRSYSVIEQGMISRFIEAKPEELRNYLEEAAGISKYKERRKETETRIRHTRENLARVADVREEIGVQLEKLQRQAKAAERYKVLKQEERVYKAQLLALHWQALNTDLEAIEKIIKTGEVAIEERLSEQRQLGAEIEKQRSVQTDLSDQFNDIQGRYYSLGAEIAKIEQSIAHHRERYQQLQEDQARVEHSTQELQHNSQADEQRLNHLQQELTRLEPQYSKARELADSSVEGLREAEQAMQEWQQQWQTFSSDAARATQTLEVEKTRMTHAQRLITDAQARISQLTAEQQQFAGFDNNEALNELISAEQHLSNALEEVQQQLQDTNQQIQEQNSQNQQLNRGWDDTRRQLQEARGRFSSLTALQQAAFGEHEDELTSWLEKNQLAQLPRLAQQIRVTAGWERAVETVLGQHLEAICVTNLQDVTRILDNMPQSAVEFFADSPHPNPPPHSSAREGTTELLSSKITANNAVAQLLQNIHCADSLNTAVNLIPTLGVNESVITPEGIWLSANWVRIAKEKDAQAGVLQREEQIRDLTADIARLEAQVSELEEQLNSGKEAVQDGERKRALQQQQVNELNQQLADGRAQLRVQQEQLQQNQTRLQRVRDDLAAQQALLGEQEDVLATAEENWQEATQRSSQHATHKADLEARGEHCRERLATIREQASSDSQQCHQLEVQLAQVKPQIGTLSENIARARKQLETLFERSTVLLASLNQGEAPVKALQQQLAQILDQRVKVETELTQMRQRVETVNHQIRELDEAKEDVAQQVEQMRRQLEEKRLESRTYEVRKKTYQEQLVELECDLQTIINELPPEAKIRAWEDEVQKIAERIQRLGAINLAAIEEYKVEEERKQYLDAQYEDLNQALNTLEEAIAKIDKETKEKFKETFDQVNAGFQNLFPRIFGGGSAYLELTGEDLLDTGVNVMARPPGKRNATIHLLSGGEKSLTAVALVFAIFQLNPAPFCLLDEVDAPLDDANVGRFCSLVKEMSATVQFVFITHNKIAMEMAEQLTGVTMHEPGVSRIVAVNVEEAAQMAAA
jgi:chromosome segregation protein